MLEKAKVCHYPKSPEEAVLILQKAGKRALLIAGGTTASLVRDPDISELIDLTRMGCDAVSLTNGEWSIGCNARIQELASHPGLSDLWDGMLVVAARSIGSRPIRNAVTVGGNAVQLYRWSDLPVALLAMDAAFDLSSVSGERTLSADEFFARHPKQVLLPSEILTHVRIRSLEGRGGGAFVKFSRTAFDFAVVDVAACLWFDGGLCRRARVVVGATRNVPWRAKVAEDVLQGKKPSAAILGEAARAAREATQSAEDVRTGKEYRARMVEVNVRRALEQAVRNAG
jgi:CO/xanthine dehydrogenase FAD-binding subunit